MAFQQQPDRSRTLAPFLGALAIAVVVLIAILTIGVNKDSGDPGATASPSVAADKALACPSTYQQRAGARSGWVPRKPYGINGDDALVPDETPTHAVVCAYLDGGKPGTSKAVALSGRSVLTGSLSGLVRTLSSAPRPRAGHYAYVCPSYPDLPVRSYLIGLSYGTAALWVSATSDGCVGSTNGSFITHTSYGDDAAASYADKRWVTL